MASTEIPPNKDDMSPKEGKKHNTGSRLAVAGAFSFVGAKLSYPFIILDIKDLLHDKPTLNDKVNAIFSKEGRHELHERISKNIDREVHNDMARAFEKNPGMGSTQRKLVEILSETKARTKLLKWWVGVGFVAGAAGAVIGFVRGDRLGNPKDILRHPIKATKLIFGPKPQEKQEQPQQDSPLYLAKNDAPAKDAQSWQERVSAPAEPQALAANR